ncbi:MAG: mannose-1-phosphate guanylyltransferase/mannose-6-phosphate isomerase [Bdellovibrionales bacterium]|nr:mannose-1-phosphate guanylyltransferase/mannose-6-phosphate isomerase [Bdellovibrionales bacterium]
MILTILSGGSGTRLWPASRTQLPKQFCDVFKESLFVQTVKRLKAFGEVQVCTGEPMRVLTEKSNRDLALNLGQCFYEPVGKNTAPAVALVCRHLQLQKRSEEIVGIFPSDHWVDKAETFAKVLALASQCAEKGQVVTIGIEATHPATGYGYIETTSETFLSEGALKALQVKAFHEKPNQETAEKYITQGCFHWNSGMFVFKAQTMIDAFVKHMPQMWKAFDHLKSDLSNLGDVYSQVESESLDYGIMEHITNQVNIPCDIGWSDLGSWDDVAEIKDQSKLNNQSNLYEYQARGNFAYSRLGKTIAVSGVNDLVIVETEDVLFVSPKGKGQDVKPLLEKVKADRPMLATEHVFEYRPWGMYRNLWEEESFKTKVIEVSPRQQLSYQSHAKRSEIWVIVEGEGEVILNDESIAVRAGSVVQIPQGAKHRMHNTSDKSLKFVEVQQGSYFGEDDIVRYQDDYNRN